MVAKYCEATGTPMLEVLCNLHEKKCLTVSADGLLSVLRWKKSGATSFSQSEAEGNPGFFLTTVLAATAEGDMLTAVTAFIASNPSLDQVELLRYVASKGFVTYDNDGLDVAVDFSPPIEESGVPKWRELWGEGDTPTGKPWYAVLRDARGARTQFCFLGSQTDDSPELAVPSSIVCKQWKRPQPAIMIVADAGSM